MVRLSNSFREENIEITIRKSVVGKDKRLFIENKYLRRKGKKYSVLVQSILLLRTVQCHYAALPASVCRSLSSRDGNTQKCHFFDQNYI